MTNTSFLRLILAAGAACLPGPLLAKVPSVVTDMPAVQSLVQQVMGDLGQPAVLISQGGDPHHYQLRPSQAASLQDADLLIWVGPEMTPWLDRSADALGADRSLGLLALPQTQRRAYAGDGDDDGDDDHGHDHGHEHEGEGEADHHHEGTDPHAWLNPQNGIVWLQGIAEALAQRDPEHAATYRANAQAGVKSIEALDQSLQARLAPVKDKPFVVFHDAYGYFTEHFGLPPAIPVSLGDASTPSAARLAQIRDQIGASGAACAFPELNHDARLLDAVTEGSAVRQGAALDPEGTAAPQGAGLYATILDGIGGALADCLAAK